MFTDEQRQQIELVARRYPHRQSAILAALWIWQDAHGWVSPEGMKAVSEVLGVPEHVVLGVVTFYSMFNRAPVGRHKLEVCTNISCMLRGSDRILRHLRERLRVDVGGTTPDGRFTLVEAECLGSCGTAPAMQVGEEYYENLDEAAVDALLGKLR
jgi:NADH-quinone oxidoreductase subunit E